MMLSRLNQVCIKTLDSKEALTLIESLANIDSNMFLTVLKESKYISKTQAVNDFNHVLKKTLHGFYTVTTYLPKGVSLYDLSPNIYTGEKGFLKLYLPWASIAYVDEEFTVFQQAKGGAAAVGHLISNYTDVPYAISYDAQHEHETYTQRKFKPLVVM